MSWIVANVLQNRSAGKECADRGAVSRYDAIRLEAGDDARRDRLRFHLGRIGRIRRGPHPRLAALDRHGAGDEQPVLDIETRTAEFADLRGHLDDIAETGRRQKAGARVDQRNPDDAEGCRQVRRLNPERGFEQRPGAPIEEFKKAGIEDDAGGVALSPFDRELPAADKISRESMIPKSGYGLSEKIMRNNKLK